MPEKKSLPLLDIRNLRTCIRSVDQDFVVVDDVSLALQHGKTLALLGESGCGKSMTALSIMGLLPKPAGQVIEGQIKLDQQDLLLYSEKQMRHVRGRRIGMIFQEPMTSLNPVLSIGEQIIEVLRIHVGLTGQAARERVIELLDAVRLPDATHQINNYPHQLSGGMKQRVMIALALAAEPDVLIADEPTTALDVTTQAQVLTLIKSLQSEKNMAILLITHDLGIVAQMADEVAVMYAGELVEKSSKDLFFRSPRHPYSRALFEAQPDINKRNHALRVIKGQVPQLNQQFSGCRYVNRCDQANAACSTQKISLELQDGVWLRCNNYHEQVELEPLKHFALTVDQSNHDLMEVDNLKVHFPIRKGLFKHTVGHVYAVDGISFSIEKGKTLALVGESGCGKTTVGKSILNLIPATSGSARYQGTDLMGLSNSQMKSWRRKLQFVFQDPFSSMNPRMPVSDILAEGLVAQNMEKTMIHQRCLELLEMVGMDASAMFRYPHEFSGGQRQRISIARALAVNPDFIVCDEPTSALDVSVQAQILNLLRELQQQLGLSYLFITHNISVVSYLAEQVAVMYLGRIVEKGLVENILRKPKHPYTQALLEAVPDIDKATSEHKVIEGELPSAINPPSGCYFHQRCPRVMPQCRLSYPPEVQIGNQVVSCYLYSQQDAQAS